MSGCYGLPVRIQRGVARAVAIVCIALVLAVVPGGTAAAATFPSYNYDVWGQSVPVPPTYEVESVQTGTGLGIGRFLNPGDLFAFNGSLYVLDSGNGRIVRLSADLKTVLGTVVAGPDGAAPLDLADAAGLFVDSEGGFRVALPDQGRVVQLAADGTLIRSFGAPTGATVPEKLNFKPVKVAIGADGTQYVVCAGVYQGIVEMDPEGAFIGFFGSNRVDVTVQILAEVFWRKLFSQAQKDNMLNIVPIEYSSLDMAGSGLIYAVTSESANSMFEVKKLDPKGNNIMRVRPATSVPAGVVLNTGNYGDIESTYDKGVKVDTKFIDVAVDDQGFVFALDAQRGRVFQYDQESDLVAVFGGLGQQAGTTTDPVSVAVLGDRVYVLDRSTGELTAYRPSRYGSDIREATMRFNQGLYAEAETLWRSVLQQSVNCDLAYVGIGKALYSRKDYIGAMHFFRLGYDKASYDDAYTEYRKDTLRGHFDLVVMAILLVALLAFGGVRLRKSYRRRHPEPADPRRLPLGHAMSHPFKAFDDVRTEDKGTLSQAMWIVLAFILSRILSLALSGFLFNDTRLVNIRVGREFVLVAALFFVFVLANWSASTWTDGEGRWRDIIVTAAAALVPMTLANLLNLGLSQVLTLREGAFLGLISTVAICWSAFVLIVGLMTVHRYTFGRTLFALALTVAGMLFVLFLVALVYSLFQQLVVFVGNIFTEILYRI